NQCKDGTLAQLTFDGDRAAGALDGIADDGETEARSAGLAGAGLVDPVETFEDAGDVLGRDPDSVIGHRDSDCAVAAANVYANLAAGVVVVDAVHQQVGDGAFEPALLPGDVDVFRVAQEGADVTLARLRRDHVERIFGDFDSRDPFGGN